MDMPDRLATGSRNDLVSVDGYGLAQYILAMRSMVPGLLLQMVYCFSSFHSMHPQQI